MALVHAGGRFGLVAPWGLAADPGCRRLRAHLFDRAAVDTLVGLDNRAGIFPVHRSTRFLLLTADAGSRTTRIRARLGENSPAALDTIPDGSQAGAHDGLPLVISRAFLERVSGDDLALPDVRTPMDLALVERLTTRHPRLDSAAGWGVRFGRELNVTEDRGLFVEPAPGCIPVVEGKQLQEFGVDLARCRYAVRRSAARRLPGSAGGFERARLAFRDVSSATNRLTLIAAIVPAGVLTAHTVFCLKTPLALEAQHVLCGLLNSFVANYLVRLRVSSHVSAAIMAALPVPRPPRRSPAFRELASLATRLAASPRGGPVEAARLQAAAASLYGLAVEELAYIVDTFPLVDRAARTAAVEAYRRWGREAPWTDARP